MTWQDVVVVVTLVYAAIGLVKSIGEPRAPLTTENAAACLVVTVFLVVLVVTG